MKSNRYSTPKLALAITAAIVAAGSASAYEVPLTFFSTNMPPLEFHGFASQGFLYSSDYNYLANDTKNGSFQFSELGLNVSMNPFPRTRIAVQGFDFDVGNVGQYDPMLDYALVEYTFTDALGLRAGRLRRPGGIYNHIQDVDLARTYVLLPQGVYDIRYRDFSGTIDGLDGFGSVSLGKAGSLAYEVYAGMVNMNDNGGMARYLQNNWSAMPFPNQYASIDSAPVVGGQVWWNTPVDGLRVGSAFAYMANWGYTFRVPPPPHSYGTLHSVGNVSLQQYSIEYLWREWTFQAEYYIIDYAGHVYAPILNNRALKNDAANADAWYVAVSHRFNKLVELGTYYTQFKDNDGFQNDVALSLRLDLKDWWIFKIEGHYIEGTGLLRDNADNPHQNQNSGWFMLAVKTTFSF